jgi:hypothetical protein
MTEMTGKTGLYIEETLLNGVKSLLTGRVNEILGEGHSHIPPVELGEYAGRPAVVPVIRLSCCERNEKERIIRVDAYSLDVTFALPEMAEGELFCYGYKNPLARGRAVELALMENPTLGGVASRAVITGTKYKPPKFPHCGEGWELVLNLRITVEGGGYAG